MPKQKVSLKLWIVIAILAVAAIALAVASHARQLRLAGQKPAQQQPGAAVAPAPPALEIKSITASEAGASLPANFPSESGSKVLMSSQQTDPQTQKTTVVRTTTTGKDMAAALKIYTDWLAKNGWTVTNITNMAKLKAASAEKSGAQFSVAVSYDGVSKSNIVVVTYSTPKK